MLTQEIWFKNKPTDRERIVSFHLYKKKYKAYHEIHLPAIPSWDSKNPVAHQIVKAISAKGSQDKRICSKRKHEIITLQALTWNISWL